MLLFQHTCFLKFIDRLLELHSRFRIYVMRTIARKTKLSLVSVWKIGLVQKSFKHCRNTNNKMPVWTAFVWLQLVILWWPWESFSGLPMILLFPRVTSWAGRVLLNTLQDRGSPCKSSLYSELHLNSLQPYSQSVNWLYTEKTSRESNREKNPLASRLFRRRPCSRKQNNTKTLQ